jgi:hypothetical protein
MFLAGSARLAGCLAGMICLLLSVEAAAQAGGAPRSGRQVYETVCATCHGPDGRGGVNAAIEKIAPLPDFTDCAFANREPDGAFLAVAHNGGPARGFSPLMAPWGARSRKRNSAWRSTTSGRSARTSGGHVGS